MCVWVWAGGGGGGNGCRYSNMKVVSMCQSGIKNRGLLELVEMKKWMPSELAEA